MKSIKIKANFEDFENEKLLIKTDRKRVEQVLHNLVSNAMKFTNRDGKILIQVKFLNRVLDENCNHLQICVIDSGQGISKDQKDRLFSLSDHQNK